MFITKSVNLFGAKLKHLHEQFGSVFFIISNTKMKWIPHVFCIYLLSSQIFYIFLWKPVIFNFNLVFWVIHEEFVYVSTNWMLWWNFCNSHHNEFKVFFMKNLYMHFQIASSSKIFATLITIESFSFHNQLWFVISILCFVWFIKSLYICLFKYKALVKFLQQS